MIDAMEPIGGSLAVEGCLQWIFETPLQLLEDFFAETDRVIQATKEQD